MGSQNTSVTTSRSREGMRISPLPTSTGRKKCWMIAVILAGIVVLFFVSVLQPRTEADPSGDTRAVLPVTDTKEEVTAESAYPLPRPERRKESIPDRGVEAALSHYMIYFDPSVSGFTFRPDLIGVLSGLQDEYNASRELVREKKNWPDFDFIVEGPPGVHLDLPAGVISRFAADVSLLNLARFYGALNGYSMELRGTTLHFCTRPQGGDPMEFTQQFPNPPLSEEAVESQRKEEIDASGTVVDFEKHFSQLLDDVPSHANSDTRGYVSVFSGLIDWENSPDRPPGAPSNTEEIASGGVDSFDGREVLIEEENRFAYVASRDDKAVVSRLLSGSGSNQIFIRTKMVEFSDGSEIGAQVLSRKDSELFLAVLEGTDGVEQMMAPSIVTRSSQRASMQVIKEVVREADVGTHDLDWSGVTVELLPRAVGNSIRLDGRVEVHEEISSGLHGNIEAALSTFSASLEAGQSLVVPMVTPGTSIVSSAAVISVEYTDAEGNRAFEN